MELMPEIRRIMKNSWRLCSLCQIQLVLVLLGSVTICCGQLSGSEEKREAPEGDRYNVVEVMRWRWPESTRPCPPAKLFYRRCHWKSQHSDKSRPSNDHHGNSFLPLIPTRTGVEGRIPSSRPKQVKWTSRGPRIVDGSAVGRQKGGSQHLYPPVLKTNVDTINEKTKGLFGTTGTHKEPDAVVSFIAQEGYLTPAQDAQQTPRKVPAKWGTKINNKNSVKGGQTAAWRPMVFSNIASQEVRIHGGRHHQSSQKNSQTKHRVFKNNRNPQKHKDPTQSSSNFHKSSKSISKKELVYVHRVLEKLWDLYRIGISFHQEPAINKEPEPTRNHHNEKECYRLLRRNQRLDSRIVQSLQIEQLSQCEQACTDDHRCISFNFRSSSSGSSVCELADSDSHTRLARFSDKSGWNFYEREASSFCSGWDNSFYQQHDYGYAYCSLRVQANLMLNVKAVRRDIIVRNLFECEQACRDELQFRCETFSFGLSLPGNQLSCQLTDRRVSDLSPRDTVARPNFEIYDFHGNGRGCDRSDDQYDYRHGHVFTCSGQQCTRGPCRIDRAGGFWYCFTDADDAVWDYCCDPDSGCHTEARMTMPTCYVTQQRGAYRNAATDTAWRPCTQQPPQRFAFLTRSLHTNTSHTARRVDSDSDTVLSNSVNTATETGPDPRTFTKFTFSPQESNVTLN